MSKRRKLTAWMLAAVVLAYAASTWAEPSSEDAIDEYRAMLADENPAELWEMRGAALWSEKRGPNNVSLSACNLGLGPGVIDGAYAQMPRWFADTQQVQDLETRLVTCMTSLQGFTSAEVLKIKFGDGEKKSDLEALSAYVVAASQDKKIALPLTHPAEKAAYALGEGLFYHRAGPHDYSCATCHGESGKRIRLQAMSKLDERAGAQDAYTQWPAYRVSQGELRTMEWRLQDCYRQQRMPQLKFGSAVAIGLTMFLAKQAEGGVMAAPSIKR